MIKNRHLKHSIYTLRYGAGAAKQILNLLTTAEADLAAKIESRLFKIADAGFDAGPASTARLAKLLDSVKELNDDSYVAVRAQMTKELRLYGQYEVEFQVKMISSMLPVELDLATPPLSLINAAVTAQPFQGRLLKEWVSDLSTARFNRLRDALRVGLVEGQNAGDIMRTIRGTAANSFEDGIMEIDRRGAAALVRTAVGHVSQEARSAVFEENDDIIDGEEWVSTLDSSTCPQCQALDGKVFALGEGKRAPAHIGCRCTTVPHLKGKLAGLMRLGTRASSGDEGGEQVSANLDYQSWLAQQNAEFQDEVLGVSRGKLFRNGGLKLDKFVDRSGSELTLDQLQKKEPAAFEKAGVEL